MNPSLLERIVSGRPVAPSEVEDALLQIMDGAVAEALTAGLLVALRQREDDGAIVAACARAMRARRRAVHCEVRPLIDTCGTGGDRSGTFNISTAVALVVAAAGGAVAKHGNRSVSSKAGSADVLEACGCALDVPPDAAGRLLDATGFAFLFAPLFHPATKHVVSVRKTLGIRTLFNLLGPLTNPALATRQLIGVFSPEATRVVAEALCTLGTDGAIVVHCAGLDEVGLHDASRGHRVREGRLEPFVISPDEFGIARAPIEALAGGGPKENAELLIRVLEGEPGARSDVVALNAACALEVGGIANSIREGLVIARDVLQSGSARRALARYVESSRRAAGVASDGGADSAADGTEASK